MLPIPTETSIEKNILASVRIVLQNALDRNPLARNAVTRQEQYAKLLSRNQQLEGELNNRVNKSRKPNSEVTSTALKILGGLIRSTYGIDIHAKKLERLKEMNDDLLLEGVSVDSDTLSKWIKEASNHIDPRKK